MKNSLATIIILLLISCNQKDKDEPIEINQPPKSDTLVPNDTSTETDSATDPYDSLANVKIDTTTLKGKRKWIMKRFLKENSPSQADYDTLFDVTYDGFKDYVIGYYGQSGTGIKNRVMVYLYQPKTKSYLLNEQLSDLPNPTFYIKQKKITGFYIGNGGGGGVKLEWLHKKWIVTKEFEVDNEGDSTKWKINYPLKKKTEVKIRPEEMIPPQDILENNIKW